MFSFFFWERRFLRGLARTGNDAELWELHEQATFENGKDAFSEEETKKKVFFSSKKQRRRSLSDPPRKEL